MVIHQVKLNNFGPLAHIDWSGIILNDKLAQQHGLILPVAGALRTILGVVA